MLDKIVKVNKNQAYLIYTDGRIVGLSSDKDVDDLIMLMILPINSGGDLKLYLNSLEETMSIDNP